MSKLKDTAKATQEPNTEIQAKEVKPAIQNPDQEQAGQGKEPGKTTEKTPGISR